MLRWTRNFATRIHPALEKRAKSLSRERLGLEELLAKSYDNAIATKIARLEPTTSAFEAYENLVAELQELEGLFKDPAFAQDAKIEHEDLSKSLENIVAKLQSQLVPTNPFVDHPCLIEIRPGVGGSEAALFAYDLLSMYQSYAQKHKWPCTLVSHSPTDNGGITEAILHITEPGAYAKLQYEGGVHRVQRVPATETKGRIHTSTAAVVVLPDVSTTAEEVNEERLFAPGELRIDVMRASGSGGQHVNTTESAVRLVHIPTGLTVVCQDERSQHKNKAKAMMVLRARLAERERIEHEKQERAKRSAQVSSTERGDRIRTYNYPNNRITDHRCGGSANLAEVMAGTKLDEIVDKVDEWSKAEAVSELAGSE